MFKVISGTLLANRNTIEFTDETISNNSIFEVYADQPDVIPVSVTVGGTTASITFDAKASVNTGIKVLVNNIEGEYTPSVPIPDLNYHDNTGATGVAIGYFMDYSGPQPTITNVYNGITDDMLVPTDTTPGGVLYHSTTGNTWKKLDASNIDYDTGSTIYSAMGDIDELETEAKNLVGAINEVSNTSSGYILPIDTTPIKVGKIGDYDLYCVRIVTNSPPHNTWGVIGSIPANTTVVKITGSFTGTYSGNRLVGFLSDNYGESAWRTYTQIAGNNVQANTGNNVQKLDLFIEFYYNE